MPRGACRDRSPRSHRAQPRRGRRDRRLSDLGRAVAEARARRRRRPRTSRRSSPTTTSRAAGSSACRAGRCCSPRSSRSRCRSTGCTSRAAEGVGHLLRRRTRPSAARCCSRTRRCPRTTPRSRCSAPTATAPTGRAARCTFAVNGSQGHLEGAAAQHGARASRRTRLLAARRPAARRHGLRRHRHHHLRPAGHADAGVGCGRRRPEERPVDPGPRRVPAHDPAEARADQAQEAKNRRGRASRPIRRPRARST